MFIKAKKQIQTQPIFVIISVLAIIISILSFLHSIGIFDDFNLKIYVDGAYLSPSIYPKDRLNFVIPISFSNIGKKEGVVEELYIKVIHKNKSILYKPMYEVNTVDLNTEGMFDLNIIEKPYLKFDLDDNEAKYKLIFFYPISKENFYIDQGDYIIKLYIKTSYDQKARLYNEIYFRIFEIFKESYLNGKLLYCENNTCTIFPLK